MGEWWEAPYKGGPMVPVPGFPRPLYPPDAAKQGKQPSSDGPDVEAYKRTVSRAGRWPWQTFDRSFSNAFSHGKSGNVADSGVAGFQRQMNLDPTGWVGTKTFNAFRSARVPEGKPHAGEMCMDVTAQNLIAEAWKLYGGKEPEQPAPPPTTTVRQRALDGAIRHVGVKESPPGSNHTKFGSWYGVDYQPWCAIFVTYCFEEEAGGSPSFKKGSAYAYVPYVVSDARNQRNGLSVTSSPVAGDLVCFDWGRDRTYDHIGLFDAWVPGKVGSSFTAVEGNTGPADYSNGGAVMRTTRSLGGIGVTFVRVREP